MATPAATCEHCGAPLPASTFFCGECGQAVAQGQPKPAAKMTMLGTPLAAPVPLSEPPGDAKPNADYYGDRITASGISEPPRGAIGRTMMGMPHSPVPPPPEGAPPAPPVQSSPRAAGRTMLGLPNAALPNSAQSSAALPPTTAAGLGPPMQAQRPFNSTMNELQAAPGAPAANAPKSSQTLLGLTSDSPPAEADKAERAPSPVPGAGRDRSSSSNRWSKETPDAFPARKSRASRPSRTSRPSMAALSGARGRMILIGVALLAFALAVALGFLSMRRGGGPEVRVRVVADAGGEALLFELPAAPPDTKIRFGGQEQKVNAGRATFALAADSLRVGKNVVLYDVVDASGDLHAGRVALNVDYRVTLDTSPLRAGKAAIDVVVSALPGSRVFLDGQEIKLDAQGRAVRTDKLELASAAGRVEHVVSYRVQPPSGDTSVGELRTSIPVAMIEIDRPGAELITESDSVEIAGAVDKAARVTIDGQEVPVVAGRFLHRMALPDVREYRPQIVATAEGKAPHAVTLRVTRVASLAEAAKGFEFDAGLTYAKIQQNPGIYRGQRVAFEGRVYNVNVESGQSALQMLVRECPKGQRCPIWVTYPAATEFTVESWVRVLGTVQGEQQFRSETDEIKVVPKVEAAFLLRAKP